MNLTNKSFGVLFIAWLAMLVILAYCLYVSAYFKMTIVTDGVANISSKNELVFFPRSSFTLFFGLGIGLLYAVYRIYTRKGKIFNVSQDTFWVVLLFACIALFFSLLQQINIYELANSPRKLTINTWTTKQVEEKIRNLPEYQGDSLIVYQDGRVESRNGLIQSVIVQMYIVPANFVGIQNEATASGLPVGYYGYKQAMVYYAQAHPEKLKNK